MHYQARKTIENIETLQWTPIEQISGFLAGAAIKGEDPRFFVHRGIDIKITLRRISAALLHRRPVTGVSSITQQTARNLFLQPTRTFRRKFLETMYAVHMERMLSKQRVLEIYLNIIEFGDGIWGCTSAAHYYFQKHPRELDLFESIFLVSLLPAPRAKLTGRNLQRAWISQMQILHLMYLSEMVTLQQFANALEKAKGVRQFLTDGAELRDALTYSPIAVVPPVLPIVNQDENCGCTLPNLFKTKGGLQKEIERRQMLERFFDPLKIQKAIITNDYSLLSGQERIEFGEP